MNPFDLLLTLMAWIGVAFAVLILLVLAYVLIGAPVLAIRNAVKRKRRAAGIDDPDPRVVPIGGRR